MVTKPNHASSAPALAQAPASRDPVDILIIGAGLSGLGVATGLAEAHDRSVVVLEATQPRFDGEDRFRPWLAASFKHAGVLGGSPAHGVRAYFAAKTIAAYRAAGVLIEATSNIVACGRRLGNRLSADECLTRRVKSTVGRKVALEATGAAAEAEAVMKALVERARNSVQLELGRGVVALERRERLWQASTADGIIFVAKKIVLAAGPNTRRILANLGLTIDTHNELRVMAQIQTSLDLGSATVLTAGSRFGCSWRTKRADDWLSCSSAHAWTVSSCINERNNTLRIASPSVQIPQLYDFKYHLDPRRHQRLVRKTLQAATRSFRHIPRGGDLNGNCRLWSGVNCFAADLPYPLVGPIGDAYDGTIYLNCAHSNAGFREAYGAGLFLADVIALGLDHVGNTVTDCGFQQDWAGIIPALGYRVKYIPTPCCPVDPCARLSCQ